MVERTSGSVCVYVLGMHRSGTSTTTGMLGRLGLAMPPDGDRVPADDSNERGHWESRSLIRVNNRLIRHFGGTLYSPPNLPTGWEDAAELDQMRADAVRRFAACFPSRPLAWKDPRTCITLPFWLTAVEPPAAAVFVVRDPLEVARSLRLRSDIRVVHGLASWERYVRAAATNLRGIPTLAAEYGRILADPSGWADELAEFLRSLGVEVFPDAVRDAASFVDPSLHHQRATDDHPDAVTVASRELFELLRARTGVHDPWTVPELGPEPEWVHDVLTLARDNETLRVRLASLQRSRAYRAAERFWHLRGLLGRHQRPAVDDEEERGEAPSGDAGSQPAHPVDPSHDAEAQTRSPHPAQPSG